MPKKNNQIVRRLWPLCILAAGLAVAHTSGCAATNTSESTGQYVDDTTITTKVKSALLSDDAVKSFEIKVETYKGIVQLSGFVDNDDQRSAAARDAKAVPGVVDVKNNLTIKQG
jgi:osmotically-inducible protein OsmY